MKLSDFDFRIWDKTKEEFLKKEPTLIKLDNERVIAGRISRFYVNTADITDMFIGNGNDLEIELWTGLYDKNGNKIYENDIIHVSQKGAYDKFKGRVINDSQYNWCILNDKDELIQLFAFNNCNMKVIGNIHENKDLLLG
ncbi:hypothetical protein H2258_06460 [Campylobacter sp. RM9939]|uniref:YopX family protein n=1 Tax=Campylobacter molothri TaxID=1032242 RepID=UPI00301E0B73|nr:hypothetical protein [Campylobacter sp. RM9939]